MTQVSGQPDTPSSGSTGNSGIRGSAESHYVTFTGIRNVQITDGQGNDNGPVSTAYKKLVPGVTELVTGSESIQIITPTNNTYTMRFTGNGQPIEIEDIRGTNNEMSNATYVVRYADLFIPNGRAAELRIVGDRVDSLKQDADGDGVPETIISPSQNIADPKNADTQPPTISVKWGEPSENRTVTITAVDTESGVKRIFYRKSDSSSFEETAFSSVSLTIQKNSSANIQISAEDNAGNRSNVMTYPMPQD